MIEQCIPCEGTGKCPDCDRETMRRFAACLYCQGRQQCSYCVGTGRMPTIPESDWLELSTRPPQGDRVDLTDDQLRELFGDGLRRLRGRRVPSHEDIHDFHYRNWEQQREIVSRDALRDALKQKRITLAEYLAEGVIWLPRWAASR